MNTTIHKQTTTQKGERD